MEIFELLETIEKIFEDSKKVPFSNKKIVESDEILDIIEEIKNKMPDELKQARWIKEERARILQEASKEAEDIVKEAEKRIIEMIDEHEITKQAEAKSQEIIDEAKNQSRKISEGTKEYADSILAQTEKSVLDLKNYLEKEEANIRAALLRVRNDRKELK